MSYMCEYGNCESTDTPVLVTEKDGRRRRYCCLLHASCSLLFDVYIQARNSVSHDGGQAEMIIVDGALQDLRPLADKDQNVRRPGGGA